MNKLKTIGLSALAGSLAIATAANAVDYAVTGDAYVSWSSQDSESTEAASGKGVAVDTDLYFNASGELDNGYTISFYQGINTNKTFSQTSGQVTLGMGSMGTLQVNTFVGSKANAIDDVMPNAMQETWDRVADASIADPSFFGAPTNDGSIDYRIPTMELAGITVNFAYTYDPATSEEAYNASSGGKATNVSGDAMVLQLSAAGLEVGLGNEEIDNDQGLGAGQGQTQTTGYAKYAYGPITVGYQESYNNARNGVGTEGRDQEAEMWAVAYSAGDMSFSYAESTFVNAAVSDTAASTEQELESIQASYTMGAMTLMGSFSEGSNIGATAAGGKNYEETSVAVNFTF
ncbi:porin [Pelagibacterales bacterium SAG-MED39]|nr:porin [Pelagibacterales bacterium SAG-MED39]